MTEPRSETRASELVQEGVRTAPDLPAEERKAFGGPLGGAAMMLLLPLLTVYLWACVHVRGALAFPSAELLAAVPLPSARSLLWTLGWLAFQLALDLYLPGRAYTGFPQRDGRRLVYRLNGFLSLLISLAVVSALVLAGLIHGSVVLEQLGALLVTAIGFAYLLSAFLYVYGKRYKPQGEGSEPTASSMVMQPDGSAALVGTSAPSMGEVVYDYFMGTALNPRLGRLDLKMFFESKIGMTTWLVLTLLMAHADFERDGSVSLSMILVCLFQLLYVVDFYWFEEAMLSTWDINNENYGFMLAFGFVVWMPFTFSLQAQYLVDNAPQLPTLVALALVMLNLAGYYIFRSCNLQKHRFKSNPEAPIWGRAPDFIQTKRGTKLLASGWWGRARHCNYLGDLTMALAWCLACGFGSIVPYFYFLYFAPLLIDRERRDDQHCARKYGDDWKAYCKRVPYRIVPYVY